MALGVRHEVPTAPEPVASLEIGQGYIWDLRGDAKSLADLEPVGTGQWVENFEDAFHHGKVAVLVGVWGQPVEIPREQVL